MNLEIFNESLKNNNIKEKDLPQLLVDKLKLLNKKIATAESCTGGLVSKRITEISGCSDVFECGVCSYANRIKTKMLKVKNSTLENHGAVSPQTAMQMARGIKAISGADIGVSTTGIAGPGGGSKKKPVGLVYIAVCYGKKEVIIKCLLDKNAYREQIRSLSANIALFYALKILEK